MDEALCSHGVISEFTLWIVPPHPSLKLALSPELSAFRGHAASLSPSAPWKKVMEAEADLWVSGWPTSFQEICLQEMGPITAGVMGT